MDMSEFDVIIGMDWLMAHRVIIDCDRRRVTTDSCHSGCTRINKIYKPKFLLLS